MTLVDKTKVTKTEVIGHFKQFGLKAKLPEPLKGLWKPD